MLKVYLIGSLRNPAVPEFAATLRTMSYDALEVFDDWYAAGPEADDYWQRYEIDRGRSFTEALNGYAAQHTFNFDKYHLDRADVGVLLLPAGKSGHLELGYLIGQGKPGFIVLDKQPERYDVMYAFATKVVSSPEAFLEALREVEVPWR